MRAKNNGPRISTERETVLAMIDLYYRSKNDADAILEQEDMTNYAMKRLDFCQFGEDKPTCRVCPVHCYQKTYRLKMKEIMRYAGPRMLIYHPLISWKHFVREWQFKHRKEHADK